MKIEVGDYVRTVDGVIAKVITISSYYKTKIYHFDNTLYQDWDEDIDFLRDSNLEKIIVKHSKNIIDLIEVGDYVNGHLIDYILEENENRKERILRSNRPYRENNTEYKDLIEKGSNFNMVLHIRAEDIKSIVTKEQMEAIQYVIE